MASCEKKNKSLGDFIIVCKKKNIYKKTRKHWKFSWNEHKHLRQSQSRKKNVHDKQLNHIYHVFRCCSCCRTLWVGIVYSKIIFVVLFKRYLFAHKTYAMPHASCCHTMRMKLIFATTTNNSNRSTCSTRTINFTYRHDIFTNYSFNFFFCHFTKQSCNAPCLWSEDMVDRKWYRIKFLLFTSRMTLDNILKRKYVKKSRVIWMHQN